MNKTNEPRIHSHLDDLLPGGHPLAFRVVYCDFQDCHAMLHAENNECMQTWIETGIGNYCLPHFCFLAATDEGILEDMPEGRHWGLPDWKWEQGGEE